MSERKRYAIILAGGEGHRAGGDIPKQFRLLCGRPLVWWSMKRFYEADKDTKIILVCHPGYFDDWDILFNQLPEEDKIPHELCCGGRSRGESVKNGLMSVADEGVVAIHDGARPLISTEMILRGWLALENNNVSGVFPQIPLTDSIRIKENDNSVPVDRSKYMAVQTPQIFKSEIVKQCYDSDKQGNFTDDVSLVQICGYSVKGYDGDTHNIKVTNPEDFIIAESLMRASSYHE